MHTLSVLIQGSDSLALDLAHEASAAGHRVAACVTRSPELADWAGDVGVPTWSPGTESGDVPAMQVQVDWTVVADLDGDIPVEPDLAAVRGTLRLRGAAAQDLAHRLDLGAGSLEGRHHIAWHMDGEEEVALVVHEVALDADDTVDTLARKCRAAASAGLSDLLVALVAEGPPRRPVPDTSSGRWLEQTWLGNAGAIDFEADTSTILSLVRSLTAETSATAGALPKVLTDAGPLLVWDASEAEGHGTPGEVLAAAERAIVVATADGAVRLGPLTGPFGDPARRPGPGVRLGSPSDFEPAPGDGTWRARFADWRPARWGATPGPGGAAWSRILPLPPHAHASAVLTAFPALVSAMCGGGAIDLALGHDAGTGMSMGWVPLRFDPGQGWAAAGEALAAEVARLAAEPPVPADLPARMPETLARGMACAALSLGGAVEGAALTLAFGVDGLCLHADPRLIAPAEAALVAERLRHLLEHLPDLASDVPVADLPILPEAERDLVLAGWNATDVPFDADATVHGLIAAQAARAPDAPSVTAGGRTMTYAELDRQANRLANLMRDEGAGPGTIVALDMPRSAGWVVAALATLKAGAAVLPLDAGGALPPEVAPLVLAARSEGSPSEAPTIGLDDPRLAAVPDTAPRDEATGDDLAYLAPAAGGSPQVMVEHRNLTNLFVGLDERIAADGKVWLVAGDVASDRWVAETLGALVRGFEVVVGDADLLDPPAVPERRSLALGLAVAGDPGSPGAWDLVREAAAYADRREIGSLWTTAEGNDAAVMLAAAAAAVTARLPIRAMVDGTHPGRAMGQLAALDGLAPGRAGLGLARNAPGDLAEIGGLSEAGDAAPRSLWVAVDDDVESWRTAAAQGRHVVVQPATQSVAEVAELIAEYRRALAEAGRDPGQHAVTLILPAYLDEDPAIADAIAREPMEAFYRARIGVADDDLVPIRQVIDEWALLGSIEDATRRLERLARAGVDEVACLVDFGLSPETSLAGLVPLVELGRQMATAALVLPEDHSLPALLKARRVSHIHCAPDTARRLLDHGRARAALGGLRQIVLSGAPVSGDLVAELATATGAAVEVMQGWPETSVWSSSQPARPDQPTNGVGTPLANVHAYVLDPAARPCPVAVEGELWVGGAGIARGYWRRDDLTAERFRADPFRQGGRLFRTGARARWLADGTLVLSDAAPDRGPQLAHGQAEPMTETLNEAGSDAAEVCEGVLLALADADGSLEA